MSMENLPARTAGAGPLAEYQIGMRVDTREGYPGVITDILEGPADLTTYWVTLDGGLGGGEYAEAEIWPAAAQQTASQMASEAGVERTAADDYPELQEILAERLPPQITTTAKQATNDEARDWNSAGSHEDMEGEGYVDPPYPEDEAAARLAIYLPPKPPSEQASSTTPLNPQEKQGFREGFEHGKEGLTRKPSLPLDPEFMAGYDLGWAEGVLVYRKPPDSEANIELENAQIAGTFPDALGPMRASADTSMIDHLRQMEARGGLIDLGMPTVASEHEAGALMDFIKGDPEPNKYWKGMDRTESHDWCRFRKESHCWLSHDLNEAASKEAGYAVWNPVDRGYCPRIKWEDQIKCPVGAPGENVPGGLLNATVPWEEGGQHGGTPSGQYRSSAKTIDMTPALPETWKGQGIYEVDIPNRPNTGCVAFMTLAMGMVWPIAWLSWDKTNHTINGVWVSEENRGNGLATALLEDAVKVAGYPLLDSGEHTPAGLEWAKKRGLNPKAKEKTSDADMARLNATMHDYLIGGGGLGRRLAVDQHTASLQVEATWADVRKKAKRIRESGGVRVVGSKDGTVTGHIRGDHGIYETTLRRNPGKQNVAYWHCGCKWAAYAWGRSPAYKRFEGRMCSHALALQYEAQSRNMFGREMTLDEKQPAWMDQKHVHYPGDYRRDLKRYTALEQAEIAEVDVSGVSTTRCLAIYAPDWGPMGFITWDDETGNVEIIYLDEEVRGRGLADDLFEAAEQVAGKPLGASGEFTSAGEAWARHKGLTPDVQERLSDADMKAIGSRMMVALFHADKIRTVRSLPLQMQGSMKQFEAAQAVCPICGDVMLSNVAGMQCMMCGTSIPYVSTENLFVTYDENEPVMERAGDRLKQNYAGKVTEFFARVRGVVRKVLLDEEGPKIEGQKVPAQEVLAPNWHPTKGLNVNDNSRLSVLAAGGQGWMINGKPYSDGVWIEVEPDLWYRGSIHPEIPARFVVKKQGDKWAWQSQVLTFIGAPHEDRGWDYAKSPKGTAKTLEQAQEKAMASLTKDHEFFRLYNERQQAKLLQTKASGTDLKAAAKAMLEMARRNEPDTTTMMAAEALTHGGEMFGLDFRFKSEGSLLRKMQAETHEFGGDAGMTAANMSDTLRYTMLFPAGNYTSSIEQVLADLKNAGYGERVKNYWERGDAYNGVNAAMMTPKGHPFELQFHTPQSIDMKERVVHPIYEKWRIESNPEKKAAYAYEMRDAFDTIPMPSGVLSIPTLKRQPMPESKAAALSDDHKYLRLHFLHGGDTTSIIRLDDNGVVEVYKDGKWVEDSHYGRYFFKGEARSDEITPEQAEAEIAGLDGKTSALAASGQTLWHGSPSGDLRGGPYGLHVGSREAARQALEARIGRRADDKDWDGSQEYGKTLLMGKARIPHSDHYPYVTGYSCSAPDEDHYPTGQAAYGDGSTKVPMSAKPDLFEVRIVGEMGNTYDDPRSDQAANSNMKRQVTQGRARKGYYYLNEGEDDGSISAVVPDQTWVQRTGRRTAVLKTADEDQCPYDASDSLMTGGVYTCEDGHQWRPDDPAAQIYHGDGPGRGIIQQPAKEGSKMDFTPDEFGSLFDDAVQSAPLTGGIAPIARQQEWDLDVTAGFATLDEEPEPALPATDGAEDEEAARTAARLAAALQRPAAPPPPRQAQAAVTKEAGFPLCAYGCNQTLSAADALVNTTAGLAHAHCPRPAPDPVVAAQSNETPQQKAARLLAYVDASLSGQEVAGPNPFAHLTAGQADNEMKQAAERFLTSDGSQKTALKTYDLAERNAIINEGEGTEATNLDRLDISGTHYEAIEVAQVKRQAVAEDEDLWMLDGDPNGPMDF